MNADARRLSHFHQHCGAAGGILLALATHGCATFHPQPLSAAVSADAFAMRRLDDAGLQRFLATRLASPSWPLPEWTLDTLTLAACYFHPDLAAARAHVGVAAAGVLTAGARPNPTIGFSPELSANPAPEVVSPWTLGWTVDVPIETAGKRGLRLAAARHLTDAARLQLGDVAWQVRNHLRAALVDYLIAQRMLALLRPEAQLHADLVRLKERRHAVGTVTITDLNEARAALAATTLAVREAEGHVAETRSALAAAVGVPAAALNGVTIVWSAFETPVAEAMLPSAAVQRAALLHRLDVRRALTEYAAAESTLQLEIAKQYPDVHLGPGYQWDQGEHKYTLGLSVELPLFNRNQGPIAEAEARRQELAAQFLVLQARTLGETERALAQYHAALATFAAAQTALAQLTAKQQQLAEATRGGTQDPLVAGELLVARSALTRDRLRALADVQQAFGALEDALQSPLGSDGVPPDVADLQATASSQARQR